MNDYAIVIGAFLLMCLSLTVVGVGGTFLIFRPLVRQLPIPALKGTSLTAADLLKQDIETQIRWLPAHEQEHFLQWLEREGPTHKLYRSLDEALHNNEDARLKIYTRRFLKILPRRQQWKFLVQLRLEGFTEAWRNSVDEAVRKRGEFFEEKMKRTISDLEKSDNELSRRIAAELKSREEEFKRLKDNDETG